MQIRARLPVAIAAVLAIAVASGACSGGDGELRLDGSPRIPDDEGIATEITTDELVLDGERTYRLSRDLRSFSTYTLGLEPVRSREGQYVQVGSSGDIVRWVAGIGEIVPGSPPSAYYTGILVEIDDGRAVFEDGTVLRVREGLTAPLGAVRAQIDVERKLVIDLVPTPVG